MHGEDSDPRPAREAFIHWLESVCAEVRALEAQAEKELHDVEDEASYRETMRRKALLLSSLTDKGRDALSVLMPDVRGPIEDRLQRFAASAANALRIGSVFYMSALLYPEDHQQGDPNDLERFLQDCKRG